MNDEIFNEDDQASMLSMINLPGEMQDTSQSFNPGKLVFFVPGVILKDQFGNEVPGKLKWTDGLNSQVKFQEITPEAYDCPALRKEISQNM